MLRVVVFALLHISAATVPPKKKNSRASIDDKNNAQANTLSAIGLKMRKRGIKNEGSRKERAKKKRMRKAGHGEYKNKEEETVRRKKKLSEGKTNTGRK